MQSLDNKDTKYSFHKIQQKKFKKNIYIKKIQKNLRTVIL